MTLTKRIIPCLDVKRGRVVKGINFVDLQDAGDPIEIARYYDEKGADELVFLDIYATPNESELMLPIIEAVASKIFIPLTVGGGIRSVEDVRLLLNAGADKITLNSKAVSYPRLVKDISDKYGSQCIVVAIDAKRVSPNISKWEVVTHGGRRPTGIDAVEWAKYIAELGAGEILLTSMDQDGTKQGFDLSLTRAISTSVDIPVIASGGAGNLDDLAKAILEGKADAVLAASIFHYEKHSIFEAKKYMVECGIPMRM